MPGVRPCPEPLRIEPVTFFIRGPHILGAMLMVHCAGTAFLSVSLAVLAIKMHGFGDMLAGWWWRAPLFFTTPSFHYWFLKSYVEGKTPHYMADRIRWFCRLRFSMRRPWPDRFPLFPRLVPEDDETVMTLMAPRRSVHERSGKMMTLFLLHFGATFVLSLVLLVVGVLSVGFTGVLAGLWWRLPLLLATPYLHYRYIGQCCEQVARLHNPNPGFNSHPLLRLDS